MLDSEAPEKTIAEWKGKLKVANKPVMEPEETYDFVRT